MSRSGYYVHFNKKITAREIEDEVLSEKILSIFQEHRGRYGSGRIKKCLEREDIRVSRRRIVRLMRKQGLYPKRFPHRYKYGKRVQKEIYPNIVNQEFNIGKKNQIWFGDISYIPTKEGMLYLSVFIDGYSRKCIGYALRDHMRESLVIESLQQAVIKEKPSAGLIIHSDRGSQYTGSTYIEFLQTHKFIISHSRLGTPYDNAMMESFYKSLKREVLNNKAFSSKAQATIEILHYLEIYYNQKRHHSSLKYMTPFEYEAQPT